MPQPGCDRCAPAKPALALRPAAALVVGIHPPCPTEGLAKRSVISPGIWQLWLLLLAMEIDGCGSGCAKCDLNCWPACGV